MTKRFLFLLLCMFGSTIGAQETTNDQQLAAAEAAYANKDYPQAIEQFEPLLRNFQQSGDHQRAANILFKMGRANRRLGKFSEAHQLLNQAVQLHSQINDKQGLGFDLTEIAIAHQRQANYDESLTFSGKALALHEQTGDSLGIARTLENFGNVYYRKGEFDRAIESFEKALTAALQSGDQEALTLVYMNSGQVYLTRGDLVLALERFKQGERLAEEMGDKTLLAPSIANAALVYWNRGDLRRAVTDTQRAIAIFHDAGNRPLEANGYLQLGSLQHELGSYESAMQYMHRALEMATDIGDQGLASTGLHALAAVEVEMGSYESALNHAKQSLKISQEIGEKVEISGGLMKLGKINSRLGNHTAALQYYQQALRIDRELDSKKNIQFHSGELGDLYYKMGDLKKALHTYQETLEVQDLLGFRAEMGFTLTKIAAIHRKNKNLNEASQHISKGVELVRDAGIAEYLWVGLYEQGLVNRDLGRTEESLQLLRESIDVLEGIRAGVGLSEQKSSYLEQRLDVYEDLIVQLAQSKNVTDAFEYAQRYKARSFLDLLNEARIDPRLDMDPAKYDEKRELTAQLIRLTRSIKEEREKLTPNQNHIKQMESRRSEVDQKYDRLLAEIRTQNPRFSQLQEIQPLKLASVQPLLDGEDVLLDYFVGQRHSLLFCITKGDAFVFQLAAPSQITGEVQNLIEALQKPEPHWESTDRAYSKYVQSAQTLYRQILKPAERIWKSKRKMIVAPDGPLHYVPFETLLTGEIDPKNLDFSRIPYLALQQEVQYLPSISILDALRMSTGEAVRGATRELIAFADPVSDKNSESAEERVADSRSAIPALRYARDEVQNISLLFGRDKSKILIGKDASEANAKSTQLKEFRTIHFASHGLIDEERPHLSSLLLNADSHEDGYLTMREVFDLKLNADLVVLSACKSGLGKNIRGEGLSGLARAFFGAGASSVLVSLWNVNDQSTAEFMTEFYRNWKVSGKSKTAALKAARMKLIRTGKYSHPYYWSPFILMGRS